MAGILNDGFSTTITLDGGTVLKVKELTPPPVVAGGEIDVSTMENATWRTRHPKSLKTLSPMTFVAAYEAIAYSTLVAQVGVNQDIVVTFPDNSTLTFWGWVDEFTPNRHTEGEQPTAEVTIIPSNLDANKNEIAPAFVGA